MIRFVAAIALALLAAPALAQQKVELKAKYSEGATSDVRLHMKMRIAGSVQGQTMSMKQEQTTEYREKILAIKEGRPVRAERTYKTHEQTSEQTLGAQPPETETKKNPIVGKTVVLVEKDGKVQLETKPAEGDLEEDDLDLGTDIDVLLPDGPVAVGDQWKVARDRLKALMGKDAPECAATCTLEEVAEKGGATVARIAVKVTLASDEGGAKVTGELVGPFLFDVSAGRPLSIALKGTMKMTMPMATLEGPMEVESTVTPGK